MNTVKKLAVCALAVGVVFGFAWFLDPASALLQQHESIFRAGTWLAYCMTAWVAWLIYTPKEK